MRRERGRFAVRQLLTNWSLTQHGSQHSCSAAASINSGPWWHGLMSGGDGGATATSRGSGERVRGVGQQRGNYMYASEVNHNV